MRLLKLTAAGLLAAAALPGCGTGSSKSPDADIAVSGCAADPGGGKPKATGSIVNHTSKPSGYSFRVRFLDGSGNEVSSAQGGVARVEPNATATWSQEGSASAKGPLTCKLSGQTRVAVGT